MKTASVVKVDNKRLKTFKATNKDKENQDESTCNMVMKPGKTQSKSTQFCSCSHIAAEEPTIDTVY